MSSAAGANTTLTPSSAQTSRSASKVRGITVEILVGAELQRVDEDAHGDVVGHLAGQPHERTVALVQRAHGRHQRQRGLPRGALLGEGHASRAFTDSVRSPATIASRRFPQRVQKALGGLGLEQPGGQRPVRGEPGQGDIGARRLGGSQDQCVHVLRTVRRHRARPARQPGDAEPQHVLEGRAEQRAEHPARLVDADLPNSPRTRDQRHSGSPPPRGPRGRAACHRPRSRRARPHLDDQGLGDRAGAGRAR